MKPSYSSCSETDDDEQAGTSTSSGSSLIRRPPKIGSNEKRILEDAFVTNSIPTEETKKALGKKIEKSSTYVSGWFEKRRGKCRGDEDTIKVPGPGGMSSIVMTEPTEVAVIDAEERIIFRDIAPHFQTLHQLLENTPNPSKEAGTRWANGLDAPTDQVNRWITWKQRHSVTPAPQLHQAVSVNANIAGAPVTPNPRNHPREPFPRLPTPESTPGTRYAPLSSLGTPVSKPRVPSSDAGIRKRPRTPSNRVASAEYHPYRTAASPLTSRVASVRKESITRALERSRVTERRDTKMSSSSSQASFASPSVIRSVQSSVSLRDKVSHQRDPFNSDPRVFKEAMHKAYPSGEYPAYFYGSAPIAVDPYAELAVAGERAAGVIRRVSSFRQ